MLPPKVLITLEISKPEWPVPGSLVAGLKKRFPSIVFLKDLKNIKDADIIFGWTMGAHSVAKATRLKWFHTAGVQYEDILPKELFKRAVVTNSRGVWGKYIVAEFFSHLKVVKGKRAGIIGFGGIGQELAREAKKRGMKVFMAGRVDDHREVLKGSDVVFVAVPLTKKTDGMIGAKDFGLMKKGVIIMSSSRPAVINKRALINAVRGKKMKFALLDSLWPQDVTKIKGVKTFPHASPLLYNAWPLMFAIFEENLKRYIAKRPLKNIL